ncbi:hypothetical protein, partial [Glaesserella parasuis]|uniref:hypothetical protein n=1 Tax=Glaesserella parasuis TaxID=738 RepID=UPI003F2CF4E3
AVNVTINSLMESSDQVTLQHVVNKNTHSLTVLAMAGRAYLRVAEAQPGCGVYVRNQRIVGHRRPARHNANRPPLVKPQDLRKHDAGTRRSP